MADTKIEQAGRLLDGREWNEYPEDMTFVIEWLTRRRPHRPYKQRRFLPPGGGTGGLRAARQFATREAAESYRHILRYLDWEESRVIEMPEDKT